MGDTLKPAWRSQEWVKNSIAKWVSRKKKEMFEIKKLNKASKNTIENISNILNQGDRILYI